VEWKRFGQQLKEKWKGADEAAPFFLRSDGFSDV
jgi:hypothetical protein